MTARLVFEAALIECSKVNAPSLLLSEYNYYINKAINNYINKKYNIYDVNQLSTDDIRVLKSTVTLTPSKAKDEDTNPTSLLGYTNPIISKLQGATYEVIKNHKCYDGGSYVQFPAKRLTADSWSTIITDFYNRPKPERPYYYINNVNTSNNIPTNPIVLNEDGTYKGGTDMIGTYNVTNNGQNNTNSESGFDVSNNIGSNLPRVIKVQDSNNSNINVSTVERATGYRYGNPSTVRLEIRYGKDDSIFKLVAVTVDYIKAPQTIRLTQEQVDLTEDTSQIMEYPDYVCQEIINELITLLMVKTQDPITNTFVQVKETIANPAQLQQQTVQS